MNKQTLVEKGSTPITVSSSSRLTPGARRDRKSWGETFIGYQRPMEVRSMFPTQATGFEFDLVAPEGASALGILGAAVWLVALFALVGADISHAISHIHRAHVTPGRRSGSHGRVLR
jgi:hypothetical protein